jgi:hypothetical protein
MERLMRDIFISHVEEDAHLVIEMAPALEAAGYSTWYYERDTLPGLSYLLQTGKAIQECQAIVLIISSYSINSPQITKEVVRGHESAKFFIPVLVAMSHTEFQERQPEWREAIGSAASIRIPDEGVSACLPRILQGLRALSVNPSLRVGEAPRIGSTAAPGQPSELVDSGRGLGSPRSAGASKATSQEHKLRQPFGEESCEHEIAMLKENYPEYYFNEAPFNAEAMDPDTYLIVGRRGCGKTSLAHYFDFQTLLKNARSIDIDEPQVYDRILPRISERPTYPSASSIASIVNIWECLIWSLIFQEYQDAHPDIASACVFGADRAGPAGLLDRLLKDSSNESSGHLDRYLKSTQFADARNALLQITEKAPVIVAIDTLEKYDRENEPMMMATAALIECASRFNVSYRSRGIHVKAFLSAEICPHVKESAISNTSKFIRNELYLHWRPKDLVRLVCWRLHGYLEHHGMLPEHCQDPVDWSSFPEVLKKRWVPYLGEALTNSAGLQEPTFPYLLRHTQMRPRQLVILCNQIAKQSKQSGSFPNMAGPTIVRAVNAAQRRLSDEVLNCYSEIYPNVALIVDALRGLPMWFDGQLLDKIAPTTAAEWPRGTYSPGSFRRLVAELGIVGTVRSWDERTRIVEADFEYALEERLPLSSRSRCVIHPMFYSKLQTTMEEPIVVYPFPDHPSFEVM